MTSPFCWQSWPNPVSLGPRPKDLHAQVPKSRPLSEKGAELIRKRRIKNVFGSTHSSPGMCIDRRTNLHSFASPSCSRWTSPSAPRDQRSVSRVPAKTRPFALPNQKMPLFDALQYALQTLNTPDVTNTKLLLFKHMPYSRARGDADYGEGFPARARMWYPTPRTQSANAHVAFQLA